LVGKLEGKKSLGKYWRRWQNNVEIDPGVKLPTGVG
jgi:hypothetical protein